MKKDSKIPEVTLNVEDESEEKLTLPPMYQVILINDDYTPMDFVMEVLTKFFACGPALAQYLMLKVHYEGRAICGVFSLDVAKTKVEQVNRYAREHEHPLLCTLEK